MTDGNTNPKKDGSGYSYDPLPNASSIRLLRRLGHDERAPLRFSLQTYNLDDPDLRYHCLSYTWRNPFAHGRVFGDCYWEMDPAYVPHDAATIMIDGRPLRVSKNLHDALATLPGSAYEEYTNRPTREQGRTLMHGAAARGKERYLHLYAARGGDPNIKDEGGRTALHYAAANGHLTCVELFCKMGALRDAKDEDGHSPEDLATAGGHESVALLLRDWESRPDPEKTSIPREEDGAEKRIWIDAICINQDDVDEKSAQVSLMDVIYSRASFVIAWLGPADRHTEAGVRALNILSRHADNFHKSHIEPFSGRDEKSYTDAGMPLISPEEWRGLSSLYQRQWFRRSWIVQEAVLPDTLIVYCGSHMLDIHDLGTVAQAIRIVEARCGTSGATSYAPLDGIATAVEWNMAEVFKWREIMYGARVKEGEEEGRRYRECFTLGRLVSDFRTFLSSDPRDEIFALGGILNAFSGARPQADYRRSVASVYADATRRIIREDGDLRVLSQGNGVGASEGLPSWVPDFAVPGVAGIPNFAADEGLEFPGLRDDGPDSSVLGLRGLRVGHISEAGRRVSTAPGGKLMFDPSWLRLVLSLRDRHDPQAEKPILTEVLWRTLCMNTSSGAFLEPSIFRKDALEEMGRQFLIFMEMMILAGGDQKMLESVGLEADQEMDMHTIIHGPVCEPWKSELAETLGHLDELMEHDGRYCVTPTRQEILALWDNIKYTLLRTSDVRDDRNGFDFSLPPRVMDGTDRLVGRGVVNLDSPVYQKCRDFGAAFQTAYGGRQVVTVDGRLLELAPVGARKGDEVWVIPGLKAPAVLRRVGGGGNIADEMWEMGLEERAPRYQFVGVSYVHGIMNGEAIGGGECELQDIGLV